MITPEQIIEVIKEANILPEGGLDYEAPFVDQGIDSLDLTTIFLNVEEKYGVELPEGSEKEFNSISKMVAYVNGK